MAQQPTQAPSEAETGSRASLIRVPLPIAGEVDRRVKTMIDRFLAERPAGQERPVLVLQFGAKGGETADGSEFERSLSLARYLGGDALRGVKTVALLAGRVEGHAVLPVLACEQIVALPDAELGRAGVRESDIDPTVRQGYIEMAERRRTIPVSVVLSMLDPALELHRVQTQDGVRYALGDELVGLQQRAAVRSVEQLVPAGELGRFTGRDLRLRFGFASHLVNDRAGLAAVLGLPEGGIDDDLWLVGTPRALRVDVTGIIKPAAMTWLERSIRESIARDSANLICLVIDSAGGAPAESVRFASYVASLDPGEVKTVAYVPAEARADAALIALACDELVIGAEARLGGPGLGRIAAQGREDLREPVRQIAAAKHRGWSLSLALVDSQLEVLRHTHRTTGAIRYFCEAERTEQADAAAWDAGERVESADGLSGRQAEQLGLARFTAESWNDVRAMYQLDDEPPAVSPGWVHRLIEFLASPRVAGGLLFIGWFALMIEIASPGLGLAGFTSGLCFLLYFWANVLNGTAGWLEVLLFAGGLVCLLLEVFVLPGVGAFGIGGVAMIIVSIILASQTFVIPQNAYEWQQFPGSLMAVVAAAGGALASMLLMHRVMTQSPLFRRFGLPPLDGEHAERLAYQEALVHLEGLAGKRGTTTTVLMPAGKARFGDRVVDVISDGDAIPAGTDVYVDSVRGNEVIVRALSS